MRMVRVGASVLAIGVLAAGCGDRQRAALPAPVEDAGEATERIVKTKVGDGPQALTAAFGRIWSADHGGDSLTAIDPATGEVTATHVVKGEPTGIAAGFGSLWTFTPMGPGPAVQRVDPEDGRIVATVRMPRAKGGPLQGIVKAAGAMWISAEDGFLTRIDPRTNRAKRVLRLPKADFACPGSLARAGRALWFAPECGGPHVTRIDLRRLKVTDRIRVRDDYAVAVAAGGGAVWAATSNGMVMKIDPRRRQVVAQHQASDAVERMVFGAGAVWLRADAQRVVRVDPQTLKATDVHRLQEAPVPGGAVAATADAVWAGNFQTDTVWRLPTDG